MKEGKQRESTVRYHAVNLFRTVEVPERVAIKRVLRLGRWQEVSDSVCRDPRRTLVEFANLRQDRCLASSGRIETITKGVMTVVPNDTAISRTKAKDAKRARQDSIPSGCKSQK